ncbi:alpha-hydroxy acid oxidase [Caldimonas tepidiphila]|uniref:alpha-hydroxy acid oxidase n=1 Tax=Caldimonas tepidiphila TaxID=2315841 RepID=UPI000E5A26EE|nr:alpha-hydroxy acid oxidase [Caldimonas tepidiphila]
MLLNVADYRARARRQLPRFVFDYVDGGAGDERCVQRNCGDLERLHLLPRFLRDTSTIDTSVEVFGRRWRAPLGVAPIGLCGLVRPDGDVLMAQAAADAGLPHVLSTASNSRLEAVRRAAGPSALQWMQLYVMHDRSIAEHIVRRARAENYGALVLTVDVPVGGKRERDLRNGFRVPFRPTPAAMLNLLRHPRWMWRALRGGSPSFVNLAEHEDRKASAQAQAVMLARAMDRRLAWESLDWLRRLWDGPLLLKGLLHPEDARQALQHGIDGLIVSNHGGRQLDAAPSSIAALPQVVDAVGDRIPVFVDSGFRRGSDVVKALALGAKAVFVGRPAVYGLACGGRDGARAVLELLVQEMELAMTLTGAAHVAGIGPDHLLRGH